MGWLQRACKTSDRTVRWLFNQVNEQYLLDSPALLRPESTFHRCLLCSFAGREETLWLCSVCLKQWMAKPPDERPNLGLLKAQYDVEMKDGSSQRPQNGEPSFCKLDIEYGCSAIADAPLAQLFP